MHLIIMLHNVFVFAFGWVSKHNVSSYYDNLPDAKSVLSSANFY